MQGRQLFSVTYDTNMLLLPLFYHFVGVKRYEHWKTVFEALCDLPGFDVECRTTLVDQEKGI